MRTKLLFNVLIVAALIGAGCAESDTFSDGLLPVDTTPPTEPVTMVVETPNPMDMVFNEVGDLVRLCVPDQGRYCAPCFSDTDCGSLQAACIEDANRFLKQF